MDQCSLVALVGSPRCHPGCRFGYNPSPNPLVSPPWPSPRCWAPSLSLWPEQPSLDSWCSLTSPCGMSEMDSSTVRSRRYRSGSRWCVRLLLLSVTSGITERSDSSHTAVSLTNTTAVLGSPPQDPDHSLIKSNSPLQNSSPQAPSRAVKHVRRTHQPFWRSHFISGSTELPVNAEPVLAPKDSPPVIFVFTSQGPQHMHMGKVLFAIYPVFREGILELDAIYECVTGSSLVKTTGLLSEVDGPALLPLAGRNHPSSHDHVPDHHDGSARDNRNQTYRCRWAFRRRDALHQQLWTSTRANRIPKGRRS